jgi:hypothetical protein
MVVLSAAKFCLQNMLTLHIVFHSRRVPVIFPKRVDQIENVFHIKMSKFLKTTKHKINKTYNQQNKINTKET